MILILNFLVVLLVIQLRKKIKVRESFKSDNINNIWMYWENKPGKTKPNFLKLCFDTVKLHCKKNFKIHLLNDKNIHKYLPELRSDLDDKLSIQQKTDYLRIKLLYKYGGIWLDSDTIVMKDLSEIISKLDKYDFVGFGCHFRDCSNGGYPKPANWVMASRKNGKLTELCIDGANRILNNSSNLQIKKSYFKIGRELIWNNIDYLLNNDKIWSYYHYPSKCLERDSNGRKLRNHISLSNEDIDQRCYDKHLFIPIYNTAPGFPDWFINMSKKEILSDNMLISKTFRKSLGIKNNNKL
jgi:hypothetical protein